MKAIVFLADQSGALAMQAKLDTSNGYPKDGVDVGGGIHSPPEQSITLHFNVCIQHPTSKGDFATVVDGVDSSKLQASDKTTVDNAKAAPDLTPDWFPSVK